MHAFRSAVQAARTLPGLGFAATRNYHELINPWSEFTGQAFTAGDENSASRPDNEKLPQILKGIDHLFGGGSPASLIVRTVLLHISLDVDPFYPTPAPLTEEEIKRYIDPALLPLLRTMMLADNEGWSIFDPATRAQQRNDTLQAFEGIEKLVSNRSA
jgi:hypothetical protein